MLKPVAVSPGWFWWPVKNGTMENRFETIGTAEDILRAEVTRTVIGEEKSSHRQGHSLPTLKTKDYP